MTNTRLLSSNRIIICYSVLWFPAPPLHRRQRLWANHVNAETGEGEGRQLTTYGLTKIGLLCHEARNHSVVLDVEGAQRRRLTDRTRGDQRVKQAQAMGEVVRREVRQGMRAIGLSRPDH